jgi:hypothetical protein
MMSSQVRSYGYGTGYSAHFFYLPRDDFPDPLPEDTDHYWVGFRKGIYCWTLQTYLHLKNYGFPCELVDTIPPEGVILAHWDSLPKELIPSGKQLIVCLQADRARHPYAQIHIVQNPEGLNRNLMVWGDRYLLAGHDYFMPLWPQPGLIPRSPQRASQFENLCYLGLESNLLPEFQTSDWRQQLQNMGINWTIISEFDRWNDYSQIDGILAVRSFTSRGFAWKPATKLFNAWHAGVPAILGCETAYRAERKSDLDYLEVKSIEETLKAIQHLKENPQLYQAIIENGYQRAQETTREKLTLRWSNLFKEKIFRDYILWTRSSLYRESFTRRRALSLNSRQYRKKAQS